MIDAALALTFRTIEAVILALLRFGPKRQNALMAVLLSAACLLAAFDVSVSLDAAAFKPGRRPATHPPVAVEPDVREAIDLAQGWMLAGDELTVLERLGRIVRDPARPRGWSAERTDEDSYLVVFREPAGSPAYAFEVDLETGRVLTAPETVERLTELRVREEAAAQQSLVASLH